MQDGAHFGGERPRAQYHTFPAGTFPEAFARSATGWSSSLPPMGPWYLLCFSGPLEKNPFEIVGAEPGLVWKFPDQVAQSTLV